MTHIIIIALTVVDAMVALLLIGIVLIQQSKGGGFGGSTFGGLGESIFGGQAADHLTKVTVVLASLFLGLTLLLAVITGRRPLDKGVVEAEAKAPKTAELLPVPSKKPEKQISKTLGTAPKDAKATVAGAKAAPAATAAAPAEGAAKPVDKTSSDAAGKKDTGKDKAPAPKK